MKRAAPASLSLAAARKGAGTAAEAGNGQQRDTKGMTSEREDEVEKWPTSCWFKL